MEKFIEVLENNGLVTEELVQRFVFRNPAKQVFKVRDALSEVLELAFREIADEQPTDFSSPFNFLASASMRGGSCAEWNCRGEKIASLGRYTSLYCDRVYLPLDLSYHTHKVDDFDERHVFARGIASVLQLRPLIESGIVVLQPDQLGYCSECLKRKLPSYAAVERTAKQLLEENRDKFSLFYDPKDPTAIKVRGPDDYLEHGTMIMQLWRRYRWLTSSTGRSRKLSRKDADRTTILQQIFCDLQQDICTQQFYGLQCGAKYLSNRRGETEFLTKLANCEAPEQRVTTLCESLTHNVPLFSDLPIETVVRIRREEPEAFENYRGALAKIMNEHVRQGKEVGPKQAKEIYQDVLLPEVVNLQARAKAIRGSALKRALAKTMATSAVMAIGVFGGILPTQVLAMLKTLGGLQLMSGFAEAFTSIEKTLRRYEATICTFYFV